MRVVVVGCGAMGGLFAAHLAQIPAALRGGVGFTGDASGGPSRWATGTSAAWQPLRPELVVEVSYNQVTCGRFRRGTMLLRWLPDKAPRQCTREQIGETLRQGPLIEAIL